jgi:hypothetical protein
LPGGDAVGSVTEALDKLREVASSHDESLALESQYSACRRALSGDDGDDGDDFARQYEISEADSAA